jgi:hypothetical protein
MLNCGTAQCLRISVVQVLCVTPCYVGLSSYSLCEGHFSVRCVCHAPSSRSVQVSARNCFVELHVQFWVRLRFFCTRLLSVIQVKVFCRWTVCCVQFSVGTACLFLVIRLDPVRVGLSVCLASTSCNSYKSPCSFSINPT